MPGPLGRDEALEFARWLKRETKRNHVSIAALAREAGVNEGTIWTGWAKKRAWHRTTRVALATAMKKMSGVVFSRA